MLSEKVIKDYHNAMLEVNTILGATNIIYYPLQPVTENPLYKESKRVKYKDPILLTGTVSFPESAPNQPFEVSSKKEISVQVEITLYGFTQYSYMEESLKDKEKPAINPYEVKAGHFILDGKKYVIDECIPKGLFANTYTSYVYLCKGVDVI